jgi:hypothetical protein
MRRHDGRCATLRLVTVSPLDRVAVLLDDDPVLELRTTPYALLGDGLATGSAIRTR